MLTLRFIVDIVDKLLLNGSQFLVHFSLIALNLVLHILVDVFDLRLSLRTILQIDFLFFSGQFILKSKFFIS